MRFDQVKAQTWREANRERWRLFDRHTVERMARPIRRAVWEFREKRGFAPMSVHVLRLHPQELWLAIGVVRALAFKDLADLESPLR